MVICFAACCNHQTVRNECSFYRFPQDKKLRALWTDMSRRADKEPTNDSRLCSCHFKDGKKSNKPTIFSYRQDKEFNFPSPKKRVKKMKTDSGNNPGPTGAENTAADVAILKCEVEVLQRKNADLEKELERNRLYFPFSRIQENPELVLMYTGLPNKRIFLVVVEYIKRFPFRYYYGWTVLLPIEDQLFITLQKLRLNYNFQDLAIKYSVSITTIRNIFFTLIHVLHESMYKFLYGDHKNLPSVHKIKETSPISAECPNCRFLLDCTEVHIETPRSDMEAQKETYSSYKKGQTAKALVAVSPEGRICFCSNLYPGSYSDKLVVVKSRICELLEPGDLIIADKGFLIRDLLPKGVMLNMPPFLMNPQFTEQETIFTTEIAQARIHVERAIQRIKTFQILHEVSHNFVPCLTKIFQVCVLLVNLQNPVLPEIEKLETPVLHR